MAHVVMSHARGRQHAALLHFDHFLLMAGVHCRIAQVELMQQLAFVDQHEAHRLTRLDLHRLGIEIHIPQYQLNGARSLGGRRSMSEREGGSWRSEQWLIECQQRSNQCEAGNRGHGVLQSGDEQRLKSMK